MNKSRMNPPKGFGTFGGRTDRIQLLCIATGFGLGYAYSGLSLAGVLGGSGLLVGTCLASMARQGKLPAGAAIRKQLFTPAVLTMFAGSLTVITTVVIFATFGLSNNSWIIWTDLAGTALVLVGMFAYGCSFNQQD